MADTNITWNGTPIDSIERDSLSLNRINENGTIREMVNTINANFLNIAKHGGGPAGIDGMDGANGVDGANVEYIYTLCDEMKPDVQYPTNTYERINLFNSVKSTGSYTYKGVTWFDNAQPISPEHKNEYVWSRIKRGTGLTEWYYASEPVLWAHWGEVGKDGDGVEYIFLVSSNELTNVSLNTSLLKIENMDDFQKVIFNIDDFYPGKKWFNSGNNKQKVRLAISKKGLEISDSTFDTRWGQYFNFCSDTYSWTDEPTGTGPSVLYEYVSIRKSTTDKNGIKKWGDFCTPALWSNYNLPTKSVIIYCNLGEDVTPEPPTGGWVDMSTGKLVTNKPGYELTPNYWKDTNDDIEENQVTWMSTGVFNHTGENAYWSSPVRITGKDGKNGEDGTLIEFIYALTTPGKQPDYPNITDKEQLDNLFNDIEESTTSPKYSMYGSTKWYDRAQAISADIPVEYMAQRSKKPDEVEWTYTEPIIWSHWGEDGTDGDGVEYIFATTQTDSKDGLILPVYSSLNDSQKKIFQIDDFVPSEDWFNKPKSKQKAQEILGESFNNIEWNNHYGFNVSSGWSDNPVEVSPSTQYQWVSIRRSHADEHTGDRFWEDFSTPVLWNSYGKRTRTFIVYCNISDETIPKSPAAGWWNTSNNTLQMSKTNASEYKSNALSSGTPDYTSYVGYWSDNNIDVKKTITWISTGEFNDSIDENGSNNISWSKPFRITGETGEPGADGSNMQFVYALCDNKDSLKYPQNGSITEKNNFFDSVENAGTNGYEYSGTTWYDHPQGVKNEKGKRTEWVWSRSKPAGDSETTQWETSPSAVIWSHWGEDGTDGDGVEYIFARSTQKPLDEIDKPYKVSELTTDVQKVIYNINDFFPGEGWFTSDNKAIAKKALESAGITLTTSQFNTQWTSRFNIIKTSSDPGVIVCQWWDNPRGVDLEHPFEFVAIRKSSINSEGKKVWGDFSDPALWSEYPIKSRTFIVYCNVDEGITPVKPNETDFTWNVQNDSLVKNDESTSIWSDTDVDVSGKIAWLCSGLFAENGNVISWSAPFRITGEQGKKGADGSTVEFVYALSDTTPNFPGEELYEEKCNFFESVKRTTGGFTYNGTKWFDNPQGIADEDGKRKEWVWSRNKSAGNSNIEWTFPEKPVIWSHWGEDGTDGDGVEYMFLISNSETYNTPTESNWNKVFDNFIGSTSDTVKYTYAMSDFLPTVDWLNKNKTVVQAKMQEDGKTFSESDWTGINTIISDANLGDLWKDNPSNINSSYKHQFVSIRKMNDGEWGSFSYPKLWSKYATIKFKSIAFTATTIDTDLSRCEVTGGDFSNPLPTLTKNGNQTISVTWTDGPEPDASTGKTQIWMTSANVTEGDESALVWSAPQKMTDTADFQVEWSSTDKTLTELATINNSLTQSKYNFGTFLKANNYSENVAELKWRTAMSDDFGILFGDSSENAILMATCQLKNGVWSDWKITRVKGEKGDNGTSVNIKDRIIYESYLTSGTEYNYENANNRRGIYTPDKTPENGDLLIVYPVEPNENGIYYGDASDGGKLYMWKYTNEWVDYNNDSIGEETGNTYVSPNGHLILWDGDSWGDLGSIVGPEGKSYTIAVKYAKDGENGEKEEITNELEIPNAKWIGICVYEEGTTIPPITDSNWKWSLFKGQDGYGYEYIFKATPTNDLANIPQVPQMPSGGNWHTTPNIVPDYWTDDPIEPTKTDRYIWMCWRKFDHEKQQWTDFMGVGNTTNAKLWHFYVTDGKPGEPGAPGEAGNGYQYKYIRYDNSANYGSTICTVTNASEDEPIFKIGAVVVSSTDSAQGADSGHTYEYRSERYGHTGSWSNWSNPVIIAKYLDDSIIEQIVQTEVSDTTQSIQNSLSDANKRIATLSGKFDKDGKLNVPLSDSIASGYLKTDENGNLILSTAGVTTAPGNVTTFADYINHVTGQFATITNDINALEGTITTSVTNVADERITTGFNKIQSDINGEFATMRNTVAKGSYVTDIEGYLLIENTDGSRERAKDNNGNPTQNYTDVRDSDKDKLIYVNSELASISQSVSDGIACTSIVTAVGSKQAIFGMQSTNNVSEIFMNADVVGIKSNYFNLDSSGLEMTGNLLAKSESGIITAGVIGNDTVGNDIKFFAGPKQKLICVKDTTNTNNLSRIFVRYPSLDKKTTGCYIGNTLEVMGINDLYNYYANKYQYSRTFEYNGGTYYMWINIEAEADVDFTLAVLTTERDYTTNNLQYHNKDFSLTPKIVTFLADDKEYSHKDPNNLTYIVAATSDTIYVDDFYDAYAWVLDSNSEGVSLEDYYNSLNEQLDTNVVIYTKSENVTINDELGIQLSPTETASYKVIDVLSPSPSEAIKKSAFRVYEDGTVYMSKGVIADGGYIKSSYNNQNDETNSSVKMSGGALVYEVSGNLWGGTAVVGYRSSSMDYGLISLYPTMDDPGLYISTGGYQHKAAAYIESGSVGIGENGCIDLVGNSYISARDNAVYKGFKTPIDRIESSGEYNIDVSENHTIVTTASDITLNIYVDPAIGAEYDIYVWMHDVKLNLNGKGALKFANGSVTSHSESTNITLSKNTYYHMVFDGTYWLIHQ